MTPRAGRLRLVLLSCAGAPLSAEILTRLEVMRPEVVRQIVAVVLSQPRIKRVDTRSPAVRAAELFRERGAIELAREVGNSLGWRAHMQLLAWERRAIDLRNRLTPALPPLCKRIDDFCRWHGIPTHYTRDVNGLETMAVLQELAPDVTIIATFHHILKRPVIDIARIATLNIHCSLLPQYRGPDPINAALRDGASETGVTIHWVDEGIDTGEVVLQRRLPIGPRASEAGLRSQLARLAADMLVECLEQVRAGRLERRPQVALMPDGNGHGRD